MENDEKKFKWRNLIFVFIGIGILGAMVYRIGVENIFSVIKELYTDHPWTLVICFLIFLWANVIRLLRWSLLFKETTAMNASRIWLIGQAVNEVAPFGSGELTRAYMAKRNLGIKVRKSLIAMAIERTSDITFLGVMAVACAIFILSEGALIPILIVIFVLLFAVYSMIYFPTNLDRFKPLVGWFSKRSIKTFKKLGERGEYWLGALKESLILQKKRKYVILFSIGLTILIWSTEAFGYYLLLQALNYEVQYQYVLIIISASWIIGVLSFLPGGLGARETTFTILMAAIIVVDVRADAATIALIYRGIAYVILGSGSLMSILTFPKKDSDDKKKN